MNALFIYPRFPDTFWSFSYMKQIYAPHNYYQRVRQILKDLKMPAATIRTDTMRLFAFLRACLPLGNFRERALPILDIADVDDSAAA